METRHEIALQGMLDQLFLEGACAIRWDHLYLWYGATRLGKGSYRDLLNRWNAHCAHLAITPTLRVISGRHTLTLLRDPFEGERIEPLASWT